LFFSLALPVTLVASEPSTLPAASESAAGQGGCASEQPASTVKSSKSNSSDRTQSPANPPPVPAATSNLNLSKSNINRSKGCPEAVDEPAAATTVKSSKSNSSE
jgi:hypothetical protein